MMGAQYFIYEPKDIPDFVQLIGNERSQIVKTMNYYRDLSYPWDIPSDEEVSPLFLPFKISCSFPLAHMDHNIDVEVKEGIFFHVNANAFDHVQKVARNYEILRRGELYKFDVGSNIFGLKYLPESVMQGLRDYNWSRHVSQIEAWMRERKASLDGLGKEGHLAVSKKLFFQGGLDGMIH